MNLFKQASGYECLISLFSICPQQCGIDAINRLLSLNHLPEETSSPDSPLQSNFIIPTIDTSIPTIQNLDAISIIKRIYANASYALTLSRVTYDPLNYLDPIIFEEYKSRLLNMLLDRCKVQANNAFIKQLDLFYFIKSFARETLEIRTILTNFTIYLVSKICYYPLKTLSLLITLMQDPEVLLGIRHEITTMFLELSVCEEADVILRDIGLLHILIDDFNMKNVDHIELKFKILNKLIEHDENIDLTMEKLRFDNFGDYLRDGIVRDVSFELFQVNLKSFSINVKEIY